MEQTRESAIIRDAFNIAERFVGKTIIIFLPNSSQKHDVEFVFADITTIQKLGVKVVVACLEPQLEECPSPSISLIVLNAQEDIADLAVESKAFKVCFLCEGRLTTRTGVPFDDLSVAEAKEVVSGGEESSWIQQNLSLAIHLCTAGIPRVHFMDIHQHGSFLRELFTWHGSGTVVYGTSSNYKEMRKATLKDTLGIARMLARADRDRSHLVDYVRQHISDFWVFAVDDAINGCARFVCDNQTLRIYDMTHSDFFKAGETLHAILDAASTEAKAMGCNTVSFLIQELSPLMAVQPFLVDLGFEKHAGNYKLAL